MIHKLIIPVLLDDIAPRFDLATEILTITLSNNNNIEEKRTIILPRSSAENLCHFIVTENINTLICGAIENEYYQFLSWKRVKIFDSVSGKWESAFDKWLDKTLLSGDILTERIIEGKHV